MITIAARWSGPGFKSGTTLHSSWTYLLIYFFDFYVDIYSFIYIRLSINCIHPLIYDFFVVSLNFLLVLIIWQWESMWMYI